MTATYSRARERNGLVPLSTKIYQGVGAIPDTFKNFAFNTFLLFYYNQVLGLPAIYASGAIMLALVVDAISDPLAGSFSDQLQTRLGRRHPLMYLSALPLGITLYLVFVPPTGLTHLGYSIWLTVFAIAVRLSMTLFQVPWSALFAEFSDDYAERSSILTFRYLCGWIGGVAFTWCTWTYIFPSNETYTPGHLNPEAYPVFAMVLGILVCIAAFATTALTQKEIPYLLQPVQERIFKPIDALTDLKLALTNRDFVVLFAGLLLASILGGTLGALEVYINTFFWGLAPEDLRWFVLTITGSIFAFITIPFLQARFDKKHLLVTFMMFLLINGILMISLRFMDILPDNGNPMLLWLLVGNEIVRIAAATIVGIMFVSMVADALDLQELNTGKRQEGVFSAAISFAGKATSGVGIFVGGIVIDQLLDFPTGARPGEVPDDLITRLGIFAGIVIPLFYLIPFYLATRFTISRTRHAEIQEQLRLRRSTS